MRSTLRWTVVLLCSASAAGAQRMDASGAATQRDTIHHPTGTRIAAGFGVGFGGMIAGLHAGICFRPRPCGWDFIYGGIAGYFAGAVVGSAIVKANGCPLGERLGISLIGSTAGGLISYAVARGSWGARDGPAVVKTTIVAGLPLAGAAIALRRCD